MCPPPGPAVRVDWSRAEGPPGLALPDDYKALAEAYGVGWFSERLMADLPDSPYLQSDLLRAGQDVEWHRSGRDHQPGTILYAFYPEPSGLAPTRTPGRSRSLTTWTGWTVAVGSSTSCWITSPAGTLGKADRVQPRVAASLATHAPPRNAAPDNSTPTVFPQQCS